MQILRMTNCRTTIDERCGAPCDFERLWPAENANYIVIRILPGGPVAPVQSV
jgi:hypothetical protein